MKLNILIPTIEDRKELFDELVSNLERQIKDCNAEEEIRILSLCDNRILSIGAKRNELLERAKSDYVCFIDDDDMVSYKYIKKLLEGIDKGVDCCSLVGVYTIDGQNPELFEHSIKYKEWRTTPPTYGIRYERNPNHLNCIKTSIAKQFKFPETWHGEDHEWSKQLQLSGLLKTEHYISDVLYEYKYNSIKIQ